MKKIKLIVLIGLVLILMPSIVCASENTYNVYQYVDPEVTVEFETGNTFSQDIKQKVADGFVGIVYVEELGEDQLENIICTLFGHSTTTSVVSVTHHKASIHSPRCLKEYYEVTACSRCNYTEEELLGGHYIVCCPEDQIN